MWYFVWFWASAFAILNATWLELDPERKKDVK
ncbi:cytochrome bd-I oxidase subunit CydX (plasmid) [Methylocystis echinoides]